MRPSESTILRYVIYRAALDPDQTVDYFGETRNDAVSHYYPAIGTNTDELFVWEKIGVLQGGSAAGRYLGFRDDTAIPGIGYMYRVTVQTIARDGSVMNESTGQVAPGLFTRRSLTNANTRSFNISFTNAENIDQVITSDYKMMPGSVVITSDVPTEVNLDRFTLSADRYNLTLIPAGTVTQWDVDVTLTITYKVDPEINIGVSTAVDSEPTYVYAFKSTESGSTAWRLLGSTVNGEMEVIQSFPTNLSSLDYGTRPLSSISITGQVDQDTSIYLAYYPSMDVLKLTAKDEPDDQFEFLTSDGTSDGNLASANSLAVLLFNSGEMDVVLSGATVYFDTTIDQSVALSMSTSSGFTGYGTSGVEISCPSPAFRALSHGGDRNTYHLSSISTNNSDVWNFPSREEPFYFHIADRSAYGDNMLSSDLQSETTSSITVRFDTDCPNFEAGDGIQLGYGGDTYNFVFTSDYDPDFRYGRPISGTMSVQSGPTLEKSLQAFVNLLNSLSQNANSPYQESPWTAQLNGRTLVVTAKPGNTSQVQFGVSGSVTSANYTYVGNTYSLRRMSGFGTYLSISDADQSNNGEWSGGGFGTGLGHFHVSYDLNLSDFPSVKRCYILVNGILHSEVDMNIPSGTFVIGSSDLIKLVADGRALYSIDLVKEYRDGSKSVVRCNKVLPPRTQLENTISQLNGSIGTNVIDSPVLSAYAIGEFSPDDYVGFTSGAFTTDGTIAPGTSPSYTFQEFLSKVRLYDSLFPNTRCNYSTVTHSPYGSGSHLRARVLKLNGLNPVTGLYDTAGTYKGQSSGYTPWYQCLEIGDRITNLLGSGWTVSIDGNGDTSVPVRPSGDLPGFRSVQNYGTGSIGIGQSLATPGFLFEFETGDLDRLGLDENVGESVDETAVLSMSVEKQSLMAPDPGVNKPVFLAPYRDVNGQLYPCPLAEAGWDGTRGTTLSLNDFPVIWDGDHPELILNCFKKPGGRMMPIDGDWADAESILPTPWHLSLAFGNKAMEYRFSNEQRVLSYGNSPKLLVTRKKERLEILLPPVIPDSSVPIKPSGIDRLPMYVDSRERIVSFNHRIDNTRVRYIVLDVETDGIGLRESILTLDNETYVRNLPGEFIYAIPQEIDIGVMSWDEFSIKFLGTSGLLIKGVYLCSFLFTWALEPRLDNVSTSLMFDVRDSTPPYVPDMGQSIFLPSCIPQSLTWPGTGNYTIDAWLYFYNPAGATGANQLGEASGLTADNSYRTWYGPKTRLTLEID